MTCSSDNNHFESLDFEQVLAKELKHFGKDKNLELEPEPTENLTEDTNNNCDSEYSQSVLEGAHKAKLTGLAFSGGGIRSATFNLGVLQALARLQLLDQFDYLSTVSGGGYIGSWFAAWIHRESRPKTEMEADTDIEQQKKITGDRHTTTKKCGLSIVADKLEASVSASNDTGSKAAMKPDPPPIWHLREYSNYLSPRIGLWSSDTWTLGVTYIRNLLLTLSLLLATLITLVLILRIITLSYFNLAIMESPDFAVQWIPFAFCLFLFITTLFGGIELCGKSEKTLQPAWVSYATVIALMFASIVGSLWLWHIFSSEIVEWVWPAVYTVSSAMLGWLFGMYLGGFRCRSIKPLVGSSSMSRVILMLGVAPIFCLAFFLALLNLLGQWLIQWHPDPAAPAWVMENWYIVVWGPPLMVLVFSIVALLFVGITGSELRELDREWLGRFFAVMSKWSALITALVVLVVYSPWLITQLDSILECNKLANISIAAVWGALSSAGAYLARTVMVDKSSSPGLIKKTIIVTAPYVFIIGMIILTIWLTDVVIEIIHSDPSEYFPGPPADQYWQLLEHINIGILAIMALTTGVLAYSWSRLVGVNRFSLHSMYADRLIRTYLGASNLNRKAHPFTGFAASDNEIRMHDLAYQLEPDSGSDTGQEGSESEQDHKSCKVPYLIVNAAINLVSSKRLAWQKRKAASFTFTPLYCGYELCGEKNDETSTENFSRVGGFVKSKHYAGESQGVSLGKAMTISGAAASPNMGHHSSPALTFLMTTFNVRLGWWLPNTTPEINKFWFRWWRSGKQKNSLKHIAKSEPKLGLLYLWNELLGKTNAESGYVYLSDGGHFENLGIYELVRRRCRIIVACDAEADPEMTFAGLGNAIEKCQIDLGVPIDIDVSQIKPELGSGNSLWHCAVGCIRYSEADRDQPDGTLVYIKSSLTGDEPMGVETYANSHQGFPHESTADQWFDESQFESYRSLGEHAALKVFENAISIANCTAENGKLSLIERTIKELRKQWYAGADAYSKPHADHDALLESIMDTLRTDTRLVFLDTQLYPNLQRVIDRHFNTKITPLQASNYEEFRAGFYFCKRLIQFMQQVYYDHQLDLEYAAPRNSGWMNLFRRWAWSEMLRFTWALTAGTYGSRFQSFCKHHLSLDFIEQALDEQPLFIHVEKKTNNISRRQSGRDAAPDDNGYDVKFLESDNGDAEGVDWEKAQRNFGLHRYETEVIREFINTYVNQKELTGKHVFCAYPLRLLTNDPIEEDNSPIKLNTGFLITGPVPSKPESAKNDHQTYDNAVVYFRIRPSMRNMDLLYETILKCEKPDALKKWSIESLSPISDTHRMKKYPDVYAMDKNNINHCRWHAGILQELLPSDTSPEKKQPN